MNIPSQLIMQENAYLPLLADMAAHLQVPEIKMLASVSELWRKVARQALLKKVTSSDDLNEMRTFEQISTETDDFLNKGMPLDRALSLAEVYTKYNPHFVNRALLHQSSSSKAFLALTSVLYKKIGHEKCFQMLLSIKNSFQQTKALLGFCQQARGNKQLSADQVREWDRNLQAHIKKYEDPLLIKELAEILFQGAFTYAITIFFHEHTSTTNWQHLFSSIIKSSKPAQNAEKKYPDSVIRRLSLYLYETLKNDQISDKKFKILSFFHSIPQDILRSQLAHSLCNRFYSKAFNCAKVSNEWEITAELAESIDIGYTLKACTQTRFEYWLWHCPENISKVLSQRELDITKFHLALVDLLHEFPNFIEQSTQHLSMPKLTPQIKLAIYQNLISMLLHYDQLDIAIKVIACRPDDLISQQLKAQVEFYCYDLGIHEIDYSPTMDIEDSTTKTISFHSDSEDSF